MSNRRGERRVFQPPGRIDDDDDDINMNNNHNTGTESANSSSSSRASRQVTKRQTDIFRPGKEEGDTMDAFLQGSASQAQMDALLGAGGPAERDNLNRSYDAAKKSKKQHTSKNSKPSLPSGSASKAHMDAVLAGGSGRTKSRGSFSRASRDALLGSAGTADRMVDDSSQSYDLTRSSHEQQPATESLVRSLPEIESEKPTKSSKKVNVKHDLEMDRTDKELAKKLDILLAGEGADSLPETLGRFTLGSRKDSMASASSMSTSSPPSSSNLKKKKKDKDKKKKKKKKLEWTDNEVFVVSARPQMGSRNTSNASLPPARDEDKPKRKKPSLIRRQSMRIDNKEKLETRWQWNQERVSHEFKAYKKMLAEDDELLPNPDEFDSFQEMDENEHFDKVRDAMLEDGILNEREIAAFFEGLALFDVKVKSLQSQLDSFKANKRSEDSRELMRRQSVSFRSRSSLNLKSESINSNPSMSALNDSIKEDEPLEKMRARSVITEPEPDKVAIDERRSMLGKSLRAMSIRKLQDDNKGDEELQRLLKELEEAEKKQKKLEKQIQQAGLTIAEDIPYEEAKAHVNRVAKRMGEIGSSEVTHEDKKEQAKLREEYFRLEQEMEKYNTALTLSDEWIEEQEEIAQKWEDDNADDNLEALKKLRRHMPINVKSLSEAQLCSDETPNGKYLPKMIAKKFKRTNVLQLIRTNPDDIVRMHPSSLENLRVTGLTLTERRAIYAHLKDIGPRWKAMQAEQMTERKWTWYKMMKSNFEENLGSYLRHVAKYGPPGNHPYATRDKPDEGCPLLGKQCHLKADKLIDYDNDYGYTDAAEYEVSNVRKADKEDPGAKAMREALELTREKKANERGTNLKEHYKGKLLQVSLANGSCEAMDESIDNMQFLRRKWIEDRLVNGKEVTDEIRRKELSAFSDALNELKLAVLAFAERSGMQLTGKKDSNADQPDIRSPIELGLSEEVCETCLDFFEDIDDRMQETKAKDGRLKSTIDQLRELMDELHDRNVATLKELGVERPDRSRKLKSTAEITREIKKSLLAKEPPKVEEESHGPPPGGPARGGLMAAIGGRGGDPGGRGGLMAALGGRGRGGGGGDLMSQIAGRGRGGRGGRGGGGGDLMSQIAARGRGGRGGRGGAGSGGGDLMSQIAARGRGGRGGRGGAGSGGGDLMSQIAARGRGGRGGRGGAGSGGGDLMAQIAARGRGRGGGGFLAELQAKGQGNGADN